MKLTVVGSNSLGNSYVLTADSGQQLCIEAGCPLKEVKKVANLQTSECAGVIISHSHGDHAKYAKEFVKAGIDVYSTADLAEKMGGINEMTVEETYSVGSFRVTPIAVQHDVPCFAFLIHYQSYGGIYFFTDAYNMDEVVRGCQTYMCECNYEDALLDRAVKRGKTIASQADRIRLSHMSLAHGVEFMRQCHAEKTAYQIILVHGSERHLYPEEATRKFEQVLGVPTYYARKGLEINLM